MECVKVVRMHLTFADVFCGKCLPDSCGFYATINHFKVTLGVGILRHADIQIDFEVQRFHLNFATCCLQYGNQPMGNW